MRPITKSNNFLSKQRGISLYYQVEEFIRERIQNGIWRVGDKLPSEPEFAQQLNVSRATVRQAVQDLVQKGMLERKHGSGTYVSSPSFKTDFVSFDYPAELGGYHELISYSEQLCDEKSAKHLQIAKGTVIGIARQIRTLGDGRIAGMETIYIKQEFGTHFSKEMQYELNRGFIQKNAKVDLTKVDKKMKPVLITAQEADLMNVNANTPALLLTRIYYTYKNVPVYYVDTLIPADFCEKLLIV
ncbi:MAG: GntR family transcriptional regulator [Synergistaceae bacterium]|jgi:GntR family transcriptional regulator|nr:GntR family transcriptional regulator [Synergistaceae bacterium]